MLQIKDSDKNTKSVSESTKLDRKNISRQTTPPVGEGPFRRLPTTWIHQSDSQLQPQRRRKGPNLTNSLVETLLTFRLNRFALTADIKNTFP